MPNVLTDQCRRTLINFFTYYPKGTIFLKSVDALDASKIAKMLCKVFREIVMFVGQDNVVHIVTDNASNYVAATQLLEREFSTLLVLLCNLLLELDVIRNWKVG